MPKKEPHKLLQKFSPNKSAIESIESGSVRSPTFPLVAADGQKLKKATGVVTPTSGRGPQLWQIHPKK